MENYIIEEKVLAAQRMKTAKQNDTIKYLKRYGFEAKPTAPRKTGATLDTTTFRITHQPTTSLNFQHQSGNMKKIRNLLSTISMFAEQRTTNTQLKFFDQKDVKQRRNSTNRGGSSSRRNLICKQEQSADHQYDINHNPVWKRSPKCLIMPEREEKEARRESATFFQAFTGCSNHQTCRAKLPIPEAPLSVKDRILKELEEDQLQKRINCKSSAFRRKTTKRRLNQDKTQEGQEEYEKLRTVIKEEPKLNHNNKLNLLNINLESVKPYSNTEMNKNTIRILKKYQLDNGTSLRAFMLPE